MREILAVAAAFVLLLGMMPQLSVQAAERAVYHVHTGNPQENNGCYGEPVYHVHEGSESEGGSCYQTLIYHVHTGDENSGSGCYQEPVHHVHEGNETEGGACYVPIRHVHTSTCSRQEECHEDYSWSGYYETYSDWCYHHGDTQHARIHATVRHSSCGSGKTQEDITICCSCELQNWDTHTYSVLSCSEDTSAILGYSYNCTKTEESIEYYIHNCGKDENTVESHVQSCVKTEETIDSYKTNCGWDETNIYVPLPVDNTEAEANTDSEQSNNNSVEDENLIEQTIYTPTPSVTPTAAPTMSAIPTAKSDKKQADAIQDKTIQKEKAPITSASPTPTTTPQSTPPIPIIEETHLEDTQIVEIPNKDATQAVPLSPVQMEQEVGFFATPVVRIITVTAGSLLLLCGLLFLILYLKRSVRLYNDDGEGRMIYLGRCLVQCDAEGMVITIKEAMNERASTNRYCVKPGLFMLGRTQEQELVICREDKRISVYLNKEMIFVIS